MATFTHARRRYGGVSRTSHQRHDKRYRDPVLRVMVCGAVRTALDWGLGGFRVAQFQTPLPLGAQLDGIILNERNDPIATFAAELVGQGGADEPARFRFNNLPNETFDVLQSMILSVR